MRLLGVLSVFASCLTAEDKIFIRGSTTPTVGSILRVENSQVYLQLSEAGTTAIPLANIDHVEVAKPQNMEAALLALQNGKSAEAVSALKDITEHYRGLPLDWAEQASFQLGNAHLAAQNWNQARDAFAIFRKLYPKSDFTDPAMAGEAQALYYLKDPDPALQLAQQILRSHEKEESLSLEENKALGRMCVIIGRCQLAAGRNAEALDSFLSTTTLYYADSQAVGEALFESALLFEKLNNPSRARGQLEDLLKDFPASPQAVEARKKLESLKPVAENTPKTETPP